MGGGGSDGSKAIRKQENERQARIKQGMGQLNAVFDGGSYGVNPVKTYDPAGKYFGVGGDKFAFDPNSADYLNFLANNPGLTKKVNGTGPGTNNNVNNFRQSNNPQPTGGQTTGAIVHQSPDTLKDAYIKNLVATGQLFSGSAQSAGFNDQFYKDRADKFQNFALPQLAQQYKQNSDQLAYSLANRGLSDSSPGEQQRAQLGGEFQIQKQGVADQGVALSQQLRTDVENQRQQLVAQLNASADPFSTSQLALGSAARLSAPSSFAPLGNMFSNWANIYANQQTNSALANNPYQSQFRSFNLPNTVGSSANYVK